MNPDSPYYVLDPETDRLGFTAVGRRVLGPRFARAAAAEMAHQELIAAAHELKGRDPALDTVMAELPEWDQIHNAC